MKDFEECSTVDDLQEAQRQAKYNNYIMDNKEKIMEKNCLILTDDLNLPFGNIRLKGKGGHGGHNGLKSIAEELKTDQYPRLRIGVGDDFVQGKQVEHVLGRFSEAENKKLGEIKEKSIECILSFVSIGLDRSMNVFN